MKYWLLVEFANSCCPLVYSFNTALCRLLKWHTFCKNWTHFLIVPVQLELSDLYRLGRRRRINLKADKTRAETHICPPNANVWGSWRKWGAFPAPKWVWEQRHAPFHPEMFIWAALTEGKWSLRRLRSDEPRLQSARKDEKGEENNVKWEKHESARGNGRWSAGFWGICLR